MATLVIRQEWIAVSSSFAIREHALFVPFAMRRTATPLCVCLPLMAPLAVVPHCASLPAAAGRDRGLGTSFRPHQPPPRLARERAPGVDLLAAQQRADDAAAQGAPDECAVPVLVVQVRGL